MLQKETIYNLFYQLLSQKINRLQSILIDLKNIAANETKSTAGDKHETALAMLQIEQANNRTQLVVLTTQKEILNKINPCLKPIKIVIGALVTTNNGIYFVSVALGKINIEDKNIFAISPASPLGGLMMGLCIGNNFTFNNILYTIESID